MDIELLLKQAKAYLFLAQAMKSTYYYELGYNLLIDYKLLREEGRLAYVLGERAKIIRLDDYRKKMKKGVDKLKLVC